MGVMNVVFIESGDAWESGCSQSTHQGRIGVYGQLLDPLTSQYGGGEKYPLGKHH